MQRDKWWKIERVRENDGKMCKKVNNHGTCNTRIDKCMRKFIKKLKYFCEDELKIVGCCCGHGKYPITVIVKYSCGLVEELFTEKKISRTRRFYKRDKEGYYYIPEVI